MLYIPKARLKKQFNVTQPHFSFEISEKLTEKSTYLKDLMN